MPTTMLESSPPESVAATGPSAGRDASTAARTAARTRAGASAGRIERSSPDVEAEGRYYGSLPVEEGAQVHGLHTETSWGATDIHLLSVGRDGRTVTVVGWGQLGDFDDAPVGAFKKTTKKAVDKLY